MDGAFSHRVAEPGRQPELAETQPRRLHRMGTAGADEEIGSEAELRGADQVQALDLAADQRANSG